MRRHFYNVKDFYCIFMLCYTDKYLYLNGGKEVTRALVSPPLQATEVKCIRFWFKSEGKYFKRSLTLFINSSDSNSSSMIWSVDEEIQKWTFFQLPLENVGNVFQVINKAKSQ